MKIILFYLILFYLTACTPSSQKSEELSFKTDFSINNSQSLQKDNEHIIKLLNKALKTKDIYEFKKNWDNTDTRILKSSWVDLYTILNNIPENHQPTLIAFRKINEKKYLLKIAIIGKFNNQFTLQCIYNLYAIKHNNTFILKSVISDNLKEWKTIPFNNITYYFENENKHLATEQKQQSEFEEKLVKLLEVDKLKYKYIICKNNEEIYRITGFDFEPSMFKTEYGGMSFPAQKVIFSGNNSGFYPHEVIHLYTYKYFPKTHYIIDEGFATYFGGSLGLTYNEHKELLKEYVNTESIKIFDNLIDSNTRNKRISKKSSLLYAGGALICEFIYEKKGKDGLFKLLSSGKTDEELIITLEKLLNINIEDINNQLSKYLNEK